MPDLHALSAAELGRAYRVRSVSPVEVTQAVLAHIARWEPQRCATWALDADAARAMARAAEARFLRGQPLGALDGVPVTLKENIATQGLPMPLGSATTHLVPAVADAPPAAQLREAGAVFIGRTTMPGHGMLSNPLHAMEHIACTRPFNMSGQPAISVPCGHSAAGLQNAPPSLPIGLQISGRRHDDLGGLRIARAWERLRGPQPPWPVCPPSTDQGLP